MNKWVVLACSSMMVLSACSSDPAPEANQEVGVVEDFDVAQEPSPSASEPSDDGSIYYLDAEVGCYALTESADSDPLIDGVGKNFYPRGCDETHALEVFWTGNIPGFDETNNLTQEDAGDVCVEEYSSVFGLEAPTEIIPLDQQFSNPYVYWFFPDDGLEAATYPGRLICGVFTANDDYTRMLSREGSLISRGA